MSGEVLFEFDRRNRCPVCSSGRTEVILDLAFQDGDIASYLRAFYAGAIEPSQLSRGRYTLMRCTTCDLIFQRDILDAEGLSHLYSCVSIVTPDSVNRRRGLAERRLYSYQIEQAVKFFGLPPTSLDVLDFGSGWELWLDMAAAYGCRTSGVEIDRDRSERQSTGSRHRILGIDELPSEAFDFINSEQVFEHLADPAGSIRRLARALRPGGLMRISVPNGSNIPSLLLEPNWSEPKGTSLSLNAVAPLEHVNCFNHAALRMLGTSVAGMEMFRYPWRQSLDRFERLRFAIDGIVQNVRPRQGTAIIFRRPLP